MLTSIVPSGGNPETHQSQKNGFLSSSKSNPLPGNKSRNPATKSGTFHGRKFIESDSNQNQNNEAAATSSRTRGKKMNSSLHDLDKLLDNDAVALLNMRKDLSLAQENEIDKARISLLSIQKEYDSLKNSNQLKEHELLKYIDERKTLLTLLQTYQSSIGSYQTTIEILTDDISEVKENILAENRTKNMLSYMISRLEEEILDCKSKSHYWSQQLQQIKAELNGIDGTLRLSRHELTNDEKEVEQLSKTVKGRTEQRIQKMNELQSLVMEGEASVVKIRNTWKGGGGSFDVSPSLPPFCSPAPTTPIPSSASPFPASHPPPLLPPHSLGKSKNL
jgi:chromosome segregation ATPase